MALGAIGSVASASACVGEAKSPRRFNEQVARQAVLCLINQFRVQAGRGSLQENPNLDSSAQSHSVSMAKHNHYTHGDTTRRIRHTGYLAGATAWIVGENIGWGLKRLGSPKRTVASWIHSPVHRRVLLGGFNDIGIGVTKGAPFPHFGHNTATYTVDLGARN